MVSYKSWLLKQIIIYVGIAILLIIGLIIYSNYSGVKGDVGMSIASGMGALTGLFIGYVLIRWKTWPDYNFVCDKCGRKFFTAEEGKKHEKVKHNK